ncbi:reverse transcriptase domain-containing protein [Tanacetum coccineum]|uniref:Reverse transcriptase domain-containing protein n=1 Tax=Tanacetum coccineum TaxID=301880 RepID=A0ABQ5D1N8_9ASTR
MSFNNDTTLAVNEVRAEVQNQNWRDLPRDIPLDSVVVLRYEKRSKSENKGKVPTEMELVLEQTQQGTSYEVSVSAEGVEELKRKVKIKGEKKEALLTLRKKPEHQSDTQVITVKMEILLEPTSNKLMVDPHRFEGCLKLEVKVNGRFVENDPIKQDWRSRKKMLLSIEAVGKWVLRMAQLRFVENDPIKQDWRSRKKVHIFQYVVKKWKLVLLIGLAIGLVAFFNNIAVENIARFKLILTGNLMLKISNAILEAEDCVIYISAQEVFDDTFSPTIEVAIRLQINTKFDFAKDALVQVALRLRGDLFEREGALSTASREFDKRMHMYFSHIFKRDNTITYTCMLIHVRVICYIFHFVDKENEEE